MAPEKSLGPSGEEGEHRMIKTKRVYDPPDPEDGKRILIDRLWPRGIKKENLKMDEWLNERKEVCQGTRGQIRNLEKN